MKDRDTLVGQKDKNPARPGNDFGEDDILDLISTIGDFSGETAGPPTSPAPSSGLDQSFDVDIDAEIEQLFKEDAELRKALDGSLSLDGPAEKTAADDSL
ncbi:MAG: hypothetical protein HQK57_14195, partial [Deltaproteobacteria bacterium]|nr:hypothetical protein [Deltaproteobacteria bacterium]